MSALEIWLDTTPESYVYRAMLAADCALGIVNGHEHLAIWELDAECKVNAGLTEILAKFGAREAVRLVKERQKRDGIAAARKQRKAEREAEADRINTRLEAEKAAQKRRQRRRLERLVSQRRALPPQAVMPVPDYGGENLTVLS